MTFNTHKALFLFWHLQKADPTQFLQLHGRKSRIYIDPAIAQAADSKVSM